MTTSRTLLISALSWLIATAWISALGQPEPRDSFIELREMIGRSEFDRAIERCKILIVQYPAYVPVYETLPEVCQYADRLEEAVKFFEMRIEDGTELGLAYFGLGYSRYLQEDYQGAVSNLSMSIENDVKAPVVYKYFQYAYEKVDGVDGSMRLLTNLCHRFPSNAGYWYADALAYWSKNDFKQVLRYLGEAIARAPEESSFLQAHAAIEYYTGAVGCSKSHMSDLIDTAKQRGDIAGAMLLRSYLVGLPLRVSNSLEVLQGCRELIAEATKYGHIRWAGWGWSRLTDAMRWQGKHREALPYVRQAQSCARMCRDFELLRYCMACEFDIHVETGDLENAIRTAVRRALLCAERRHSPGYVAALNDIAWAYHEVGENEVSLNLANAALAIAETASLDERNLCQTHTSVGLAYQGLGQCKEALRHFLAAHELNPKDNFHDRVEAITRGNLGSVYLLLGDVSKARENFLEQLRLAKVERFDRELTYALANIGRHALATGEIEKAVGFFAKSLDIARQCGYRPAMLLSLKWLANVNARLGKLRLSQSFYTLMGSIADSMVSRGDKLNLRRRLLSR